MHLVIDRPTDHQVWDRAEPVAGWIEGVRSLEGVRAVCGGVELPLRACAHPRGLERDDLHGFWTELVVQRHLDAVRDGMLTLELWRATTRLGAVPLWLSPFVLELARTHPLDVAQYPVPPAPGAGRVPRTLVFPGLGAVGGSSLNRLMRAKMLREGWPTPVYDEPNVPALWARVCARHAALRFRWIDGHGCYGAGAGDAVRVTVLRDPVRRLVSVFNYGVLVHPDEFAGASFDDFVAAGAARRHSQAVGLLRVAGRSADLAGAALHRAAHAELAHGYAVVGITERFEETIMVLAQLAGYDAIGMWRPVLAAPRAVDPDRLSAATRRRLTSELAVDLELYAEARESFERRVAAAAFGPMLARYREGAGRVAELSATAKAVELLRWRQVLGTHAHRPVGSAVRVANGGG